MAKLEYEIRKGKKKIDRHVINPMQAKKITKNSEVLALAKKALAEKLDGKGKYRVSVIIDGEKSGEWTCVPAKTKKVA